MRKNSLYIFPIIAVGLLFAKKALAVCPICTVAVATGIGFSRWLGIDDTITGLWIGGLTVSLKSIGWERKIFDLRACLPCLSGRPAVGRVLWVS